MAHEKDTTSVVDRVHAMVAEKVRHGVPRHEAFYQIAKQHPELREAYDREFATATTAPAER